MGKLHGHFHRSGDLVIDLCYVPLFDDFGCKSDKIVKIFAQWILIWIWLKLLQLFHKFNEFQYRISNFDEILFTARLYRIGAFLHPWNCRGDSTPRILPLGYDQSLELVSKELNDFGVIAGLFRQIGGHSSRFVLFCFEDFSL